MEVPVGTTESSPQCGRRMSAKLLAACGFCRPYRGLRTTAPAEPSDESLGYFRASLPGLGGIIAAIGWARDTLAASEAGAECAAPFHAKRFDPKTKGDGVAFDVFAKLEEFWRGF